MGDFNAEICNEAHDAQAALDRNLKGLMTPGVLCPKDQILCFFCSQEGQVSSPKKPRLLLAAVSVEAGHSAPLKRCCRMRPLACIYIAW